MLRGYLVTIAAVRCPERLHVNHTRFGEELHPTFFSEVQIVLVECVFRPVAAAHHAAAAGVAGGARRTVAAEVRIGVGEPTGFTFGCLEDADVRAIERRTGT